MKTSHHVILNGKLRPVQEFGVHHEVVEKNVIGLVYLENISTLEIQPTDVPVLKIINLIHLISKNTMTVIKNQQVALIKLINN